MLSTLDYIQPKENRYMCIMQSKIQLIELELIVPQNTHKKWMFDK